MDNAVMKAKEVIATYSIQHPTAENFDAIFSAEKIKVASKYLDQEPNLSGMLIYKGGKKGIIVNTIIPNTGRINFTKAHELGHYFLKHTPNEFDGTTGFRCNNEDMYLGYNKVEAEANKFAVEFLMPEQLFRLMLAGAPVDFALITTMAREFKVSKHASSFRILDFVKTPHAIILSTGINITSCKQSKGTNGCKLSKDTIPQNTLAHKIITTKKYQAEFEQCNSNLWFTNPLANIKLYSCTKIHKESNTAMTILRW